MTKDKNMKKNNTEFECCIKCDEPVCDKGMTTTEDMNGNGWFVSACDNPKCERYGLLTVITK